MIAQATGATPVDIDGFKAIMLRFTQVENMDVRAYLKDKLKGGFVTICDLCKMRGHSEIDCVELEYW